MYYQSVSGQFFPRDKKEQDFLLKELFLRAKKVSVSGVIKGLIVPHAGWIYSGVVAAVGYKLLYSSNAVRSLNSGSSRPTESGSNNNYQIILVGPSHREYFSGVKEEICDHSVEVQIPFLKKVAPDAKILPMVYGEIAAQELADKIETRLDKDSIIPSGTSSLIVISSDLSHYYPYDVAVKIDSQANKYIPELKIEKVEQEVEACGKTGILALMFLAKKFGWQGLLLDYKNSGDTAGDKSAVVGYGCYAFYV